MPGVAIHGSMITETIKPNHVRYRIEEWEEPWCAQRDPDTGDCTDPRGGTWNVLRYDAADVKITGHVSVPSSQMSINGASVAKVGDHTIESWEVIAPIVGENQRYWYEDVTSDSGVGQIISGSSKATLDGQAIALIGSQVRTCLDTTTTIADGSSKLSFPS